MSLRSLATDDLNIITTTGFAVPIIITNPAGASDVVQGYSNDIANVIDPDTGQIISGRAVSVAISLRSLSDKGFGIPQGIEKATSRPWLVSFEDAEHVSYIFKILSSNPDRALGIVTCECEFYND